LQLLNKLHVPVGLITSAVGASGCQAWTSRETLLADTALNTKYLYPFDTSAVSKETLDSVVTFEKVLRPTLLYNAMIYPLRNISLRGFLWYQGESNKDDGAMYTKLCTAMIHNWRKLFDQGNLPFYFVQVAPYSWLQNDSTAFNYAVFREAQEAILKDKNTGMALTMDIGDPDDIHPRDKKNVGSRLAFDALANTYGMKDIPCIGPQFTSFTVEKDHAIISFERKSIGAGLTTSDQQPPKHFFIAGDDKVFYPAIAELKNDKVIVIHPK
jgi:sialate O-acetylesterase